MNLYVRQKNLEYVSQVKMLKQTYCKTEVPISWLWPKKGHDALPNVQTICSCRSNGTRGSVMDTRALCEISGELPVGVAAQILSILQGHV